VLKGLSLLLDKKEARRPASSPQLLGAGRHRVLSHLPYESKSYNKRVPPSLTTFAPENPARAASRVDTLEQCAIAHEWAFQSWDQADQVH